MTYEWNATSYNILKKESTSNYLKYNYAEADLLQIKYCSRKSHTNDKSIHDKSTTPVMSDSAVETIEYDFYQITLDIEMLSSQQSNYDELESPKRE